MSKKYEESKEPEKNLSEPAKAGVVAIKATYDVRKLQYAMQKEQNKILESNRTIFEKEFNDVTMDNFAKQVRLNNAKDLLAIGAFNVLIKSCAGIPFGVAFNKMSEILPEISSLSDEVLINLAMGKPVKIFDNSIMPAKLPILGGGEFWGSSLSTFYSASLGIINMTMREAPISSTVELGHSSIVHSFKMPDTFDAKLIPKNHYINKDHLGQITLTVFHSGYSFGGSYRDLNPFSPQDCGTFAGRQNMAHKLLPKATTSTADLLCVFRHYEKLQNPYLEKTVWNESGTPEIVKIFDVNNTQNVVGSTYFFRRFNKDAPETTTLGASGHTAIIIGKDNFGDFVTIGANRDMPKMEGYGLQTFSSSEPEVKGSEPYKKSYILAPTKEVLTQPEFSRFSEIDYNGIDDLTEVVNYFDKELSGDIYSENY
jgi:hypothetical protein